MSRYVKPSLFNQQGDLFARPASAPAAPPPVAPTATVIEFRPRQTTLFVRDLAEHDDDNAA